MGSSWVDRVPSWVGQGGRVVCAQGSPNSTTLEESSEERLVINDKR